MDEGAWILMSDYKRFMYGYLRLKEENARLRAEIDRLREA